MNFLKTENVGFLEENQRGNRGFGQREFGRCDGALIVTFVVIQSRQTLLRWRPEELMADLHRIDSPVWGLFPNGRAMLKTNRKRPFRSKFR